MARKKDMAFYYDFFFISAFRVMNTNHLYVINIYHAFHLIQSLLSLWIILAEFSCLSSARVYAHLYLSTRFSQHKCRYAHPRWSGDWLQRQWDAMPRHVSHAAGLSLCRLQFRWAHVLAAHQYNILQYSGGQSRLYSLQEGHLLHQWVFTMTSYEGRGVSSIRNLTVCPVVFFSY